MTPILSPERVIDRLVTQNLFADLDPVSLRVLALASEERTLQPGEILFEAGDQADAAYLVLGGGLCLDFPEGGTVYAEADDLLHPLALIASLQRPFTASADEASVVLKIPRAVFTRIVNNAPAFTLRLREKLNRDLMKYRKNLTGIEGMLTR